LYRRARKGAAYIGKPRRAGRSWRENAKLLSKSAASSIKSAGGPVSRILCRTQSAKQPARAAIIPLGHDSHRDSSSLPEGSHPRWLAPPQKERVHFHERSLIEPGRLSPPIWPCTTRGFPCLRCLHRSGGLLPHLFTLAKRCVHFEDVPQVSLRDATVLRSAGGLFSVALSVALRVAQALACAPHRAPWRYQARCPVKSSAPHKVKSVPQDGVRTFLPPRLCSGGFTPPLLRRSQRSPGPPANSYYTSETYGICPCSKQKRTLQSGQCESAKPRIFSSRKPQNRPR